MWWRLGSDAARSTDEMNAITQYMMNLIYAQRGFDPDERYGQTPNPWGS
jgi:alpha-N-acetylglucosamine transferase